VLEETIEKGRKQFTVGVLYEDEIIAKSIASNKKEASKIAAEEAIKKLALV
jgi:ribonuclease-3